MPTEGRSSYTARRDPGSAVKLELVLAEQHDDRLAGTACESQLTAGVGRLELRGDDACTPEQRRQLTHGPAEHLDPAEHASDLSRRGVDIEGWQLAHERQLGQVDVRGRIVCQQILAVLGVHDDRTEALALDHRRWIGVQRDAHAQRPAAVQQLAGERDGEVTLGQGCAVSKRRSGVSTQAASPKRERRATGTRTWS